MTYKNVKFVPISLNRKTGKIPVTYTEESSCPDSCPLKTTIDKSTGDKKYNGCYAPFSFTGITWRRLSAMAIAMRIITWRAFLGSIRKLPIGQVWRHNVAGDLPHQLFNRARIAARRVSEIVSANHERKGFTYSHYDVLSDTKNAEHNREVIKRANRFGFAINVSTDSHELADKALALGIGPVVTMLPSDATERDYETPNGNRIMLCPALWERDSLTCKTCKLCSLSSRTYVIGFKAHGSGKRKAQRFLNR